MSRRKFFLALLAGALVLGAGCGSDSPTTTPPPSPPVAAIAVDPPVGTLNTDFHFDASSSSNPADTTATLRYRWDWESDGTWDTEYADSATVTHRFSTVGTKTVTVETTNGTAAGQASGTASVISCTNGPVLDERFDHPDDFATTWQVMDGTVAVVAGGLDNLGHWARGNATGEHDPAMALLDPCSYEWSDYTLEYDVVLGANDAYVYAIAYFYLQATDGWNITPRDSYGISMGAQQDRVWLYRYQDGVGHQVTSVPLPVNAGRPYHVRIAVRNHAISVAIDGVRIISFQDETFAGGSIALSASTGGGMWTHVEAFYDNIRVTPAGPNTPPTASLAVRPDSGPVGVDIVFNASGCADEEDAPGMLAVRWDWDGNGTWDTEYATDRVVAHHFDTPGTRTVRMEVRDSEGAVATAGQQVTVLNCPSVPALVEGFEIPTDFAEKWLVQEGTVEVEPGGFGTGDYWAHGHNGGGLGAGFALASGCALGWTDYTVDFDVKIASNDEYCYARVFFRVPTLTGWTDWPRDGYGFTMGVIQDAAWFYTCAGGVAHQVFDADLDFSRETAYHVTVEVRGSSYRLLVDGVQVMQGEDSAVSHGTIGFGAATGGGLFSRIDAWWDNIVVRPITAGGR